MRAIVARHYGGFGAVKAMSWEEYALARKVLLEEHIGTRVRQAKRDEEALAKKTKGHAQRMAR